MNWIGKSPRKKGGDKASLFPYLKIEKWKAS